MDEDLGVWFFFFCSRRDENPRIEMKRRCLFPEAILRGNVGCKKYKHPGASLNSVALIIEFDARTVRMNCRLTEWTGSHRSGMDTNSNEFTGHLISKLFPEIHFSCATPRGTFSEMVPSK